MIGSYFDDLSNFICTCVIIVFFFVKSSACIATLSRSLEKLWMDFRNICW